MLPNIDWATYTYFWVNVNMCHFFTFTKFHYKTSKSSSMSWNSAGTSVHYQDGWIIGARHWYSNVEIEAIFVLLCVWIPHLGAWKALEHHVNDLNTGIGAMVCFLGARPPKRCIAMQQCALIKAKHHYLPTAYIRPTLHMLAFYFLQSL